MTPEELDPDETYVVNAKTTTRAAIALGVVLTAIALYLWL